MIEEKLWDHTATKMILKEYLAPLKDQRVDTLLLGCTHYPLLLKLFREEMGDEVAIVDSASTCAEAVASVLSGRSGLLSLHKQPEYRYFVSDDPQKFKTLSKEFLGVPVENVASTLYFQGRV